MGADNSARDTDVDPEAFLRALLNISTGDAEKAREDSPATRPRKPPEGPRHDYGDSDSDSDSDSE